MFFNHQRTRICLHSYQCGILPPFLPCLERTICHCWNSLHLNAECSCVTYPRGERLAGEGGWGSILPPSPSYYTTITKPPALTRD